MATESGRIEKTCEECGETFSVYPAHNQKYCSRECFNISRRIRDYEGHEKTTLFIYGFERNLVERAHDIMEERHGERFPLHIVVAHLARLYIDEFGDGATEEAADGD